MYRSAGILFFCLVVIISMLFSGCGDDDDGGDQQSLYQKLGERAGIESAVEKSILAIASDPDLTPFFAVLLQDENGEGPGLEALKDNIADFIDEATGGDATYGGLSMQAAHAATNPRMANAENITNATYDSFLDAMISGAKQAGISNESTLSEYRNLLEQSRSSIVP